MGRVSGKVAIVTGGARGIGAGVAKALVDEGAKVVVADILDDDGNALVETLGADNARYIRLDVTDYQAWEQTVATTLEAFGRLDILVNNAGIANFGPIDEYSLDDWHKIVDINLHGVFYGMKVCIPALKESGKGSIINLSSTAGLQGYEALPGYNATKFAVRGLTKNAALDLGRYNIRVNSVHPGVVRTPMTEGLDTKQSHVALHRVGEVSELAAMILFLASDESGYSTGAEFLADGGELAGLAHYED